MVKALKDGVVQLFVLLYIKEAKRKLMEGRKEINLTVLFDIKT